MPAEETPPNSPSISTGLNDDGDNEVIPFDENNIVEIIEDDDNDEGNPIIEEGEEDDEEVEDMQPMDEPEVIPERDDAQIVFKEHKEGVLSCEFHPKSPYLVASGGIDDNAFIWDATNGNKLFTCTGHEDSVEVVSFSHDGSYLATADLKGVIKVWRTKDFNLIETFRLDDELGWIQWHHGTNVLVASSQIGMIYMYKIPSGDIRMVMASFGQNCLAGKILPDGKSLACGYKDGNLKIIDLKQGTVIKDIKPFDDVGGITCLDVHKNNSLVICGCESGAVMLINSSSGKIASVLQGPQNDDGSTYIEAVSFCKDPTYQVAASGALDGTLIIWDIVRQTLRHKYKFSACVNHLTWHPTLSILFICNFEEVARVYDARAGVVLKDFLGHRKSCLNMSLSGDASLLMTTSEDKTVRIFSVSNIS